jgi:uracil-DNA glycosylase
MKPAEIFQTSLKIRNDLRQNYNFVENPIDPSLLPVLPYRISNKVQLIILGQDPTVKNEKSRESIEYALNLDKGGSLKNYIQVICKAINIPWEHIYATNVVKYFYTRPPATTLNILHEHLPPNLELLQNELSAYPKARIITLGEPVLQLLTNVKVKVQDFWNYDRNTGKTNGRFTFCDAKDNKLNRKFYPFPHQTSLRKNFYMETLEDYLRFVGGRK